MYVPFQYAKGDESTNDAVVASIRMTNCSSSGGESSQPEDPCESIDCDGDDGVCERAVFHNELDADQVDQDEDRPE